MTYREPDYRSLYEAERRRKKTPSDVLRALIDIAAIVFFATIIIGIIGAVFR